MKQEAGSGFPPWPGSATRDIERNLAAHRELQAHRRALWRAGWKSFLVGAAFGFLLSLEWPTVCAYMTLLRRGIGV